MKTEARKMAEKMSKSKKEEDINELAREISRGGKPKGISSDIPVGVREALVMKEREAMFKKGEENKYAYGGMTKKKTKKYAVGGMSIPSTRQDPANSNIMPKDMVIGSSTKEQQSRAQQAEMAKFAPQTTSYMPSAQISQQQALPQKQKTKQSQQQQNADIFALPQQENARRQKQQQQPQQTNTMQASMSTRGPGMSQKQVHELNRPARTQQQMMAKGGAVKKMAKGGMAMCGASMPPAQKRKK